MQRLTGNKKKVDEQGTKNSVGKPTTSSTNLRKEEARSLNNRPFAKKKVDSSKDILNRMKEIKAQYNARSQNNNAKAQALANKVSELT